MWHLPYVVAAKLDRVVLVDPLKYMQESVLFSALHFVTLDFPVALLFP
jgi:hypothetical protein